MEPPGGGRDSRFNLGYSMNLLSGEAPSELYNTSSLGGSRVGGLPSTSLQQLSPPPGSRHHQQTMLSGSSCAGGGGNSRSSGTSLKSDICYDDRGMSSQGMGGMEGCGGVSDMSEDTYGGMQPKKSPPSNGKKTKGRVKIKMEYIENKLRRYTTFSKRKTGIMKKAYELSTLTGTQVMLLVASETGHVYTFATRKLQPMITSEAGKALIQTCLNSPDPPAGSASGDQRMSATGFEETELTYNISDEDSKDENISGGDSSDSSEAETHEDETEIIFVPQQQQQQQQQQAPSQKSTNNSTTPSAPPSLISIANLPKNSQKNSRNNSTASGGQSNSNNNNLATSISISQPTSTSSNNNNNNSSSSQNPSKISSSNSAGPPPPLLSPLVYPTPQGMMYATQNGGMIFSIAPHQSQDSGSGGVHHHHHAPQFITIPLSMVTAAAANGGGGQTGGELDLSSKRSSNK